MVNYKRTQWDDIYERANQPAEQVHIGAQLTSAASLENTAKQTRTKRFGFAKILALVLVGALALGGAAGAGYRLASNFLGGEQPVSAYFIESNQVKMLTNSTQTNGDIPSIVSNLEPNIVAITNQQLQRGFIYGTRSVPVSGTGVVFNINQDSILMITNYHVVENSNGLVVAFNESESAEATLVGADPDADIAVIKVIKADVSDEILAGLSGVILGDSDQIKVGEMVLAIGNPLGYTDTLTVGYISGVNRDFEMSTGKNQSLIQTDAAINPGNSGGAMVNLNGEVIGINTVKIADTNVEGIGFAVPINEVKSIIGEILEKGYVSKPYMGISGKTISEDIASMYQITPGVIIEYVEPKSGADQAGLKRGDIIIDVDNTGIKTFEKLIDYIQSQEIGSSVAITVNRDNQTLTFDVVLSERKQ